MTDKTKIQTEGILSEGYGIVPKTLMKSGLSLSAKAVMCYMLTYTGGGKDSCFPTIQTMSDHLKTSKPTLIKAIDELEDAELIKREKLYPGDPLRQHNKYVVKIFNGQSKNSLLSQGKEFLPSRSKILTHNITSINNTSINKGFSFSLEDITGFIDEWNTTGLPKYPESKYKIGMNIPCVQDLLKNISFFTREEIQQAIRNYAKIFKESKYEAFPVYPTAVSFLTKGIENYYDAALPFKRCARGKYEEEQASRRPKISPEETKRILEEKGYVFDD